MLDEAGIDPKVFDNPDNRVFLAARSRLVALGAARTGCPHFGLLVGQEGGLHSFGLVGLLVKYSPDVGTALRSLARFFHLHSRGSAVNVAIDGDNTVFSYSLLQPQLEGTDITGDAAVALMLQIMCELCGTGWKPLEACFAHRRPADVRPFRELFNAPLRFDAEQYALVFATAWLGHPLPAIDPVLHRLLQDKIDALEATFGEDFPAQVRSVLRSVLLTDDASADSVAALFSMHSRTLHRHLQAFGTRFRELVEEERFAIARQMLEDSSMAVCQITDLLAYADASAFTRAFRRWSGTTPTQWRLERGVPMPRGKQAGLASTETGPAC